MMKLRQIFVLLTLMAALADLTQASVFAKSPMPQHHTVISIKDGQFRINGKLTYAGRTYRGMKVEGLLMNSRMVQGVFDDLNPDTRSRWNYADGPWDPDRNTREFCDAMPLWKAHGLLCVVVSLQGGSPEGYSKTQPWVNSAFETDGRLRTDYMARLKRILDRADELGMVVMLGYFYFGQEPRLVNEHAVTNAVDQATDWLVEQGYTNVLVEIANEADDPHYHEILKPARAQGLIARVQQRSAHRLLVSTSLTGHKVPGSNLVNVADFLLLHGNGENNPAHLRDLIDATRAVTGYHNQPILINEDDHYDFDKPDNHLLAAVSRYTSWGFFDYRRQGESFAEGYQSVPVNWGISSERKRQFFALLSQITGVQATAQ